MAARSFYIYRLKQRDSQTDRDVYLIEDRFDYVIAMSIMVLNLYEIQCALLRFLLYWLSFFIGGKRAIIQRTLLNDFVFYCLLSSCNCEYKISINFFLDNLDLFFVPFSLLI